LTARDLGSELSFYWSWLYGGGVWEEGIVLVSEGSTPLLLKKEHYYHPGCPGCDHDRRKELQRGMPYKEFLYIWMICLTAGTVSATLSCLCNLISKDRSVNYETVLVLLGIKIRVHFRSLLTSCSQSPDML
jgi:hypothetical protein